IHKIPSNYPLVPSLMHCFYRETAQKGSRFIAVSEAVTDMYKTSYRYGPDQDAVQIVKGRRLMSTRSSDTLGVKVMGGPIIPIMLDVVKNVEVLLNENELYFYRLTLDPPEVIAERPQFVINIRPQYVIDRPLFYGRLFIDQESLAFTRVELQLDMSDKANATQYMLVRKPRGLRFNPKELSTIINYKTIDGVTRISYVRNVMRFKCDWRRRLFASTYTVTTEMVVTENLQGDAVHSIRGRDSFGSRDLFYDKVAYFDEPDFWGNYNIIEPTESLEHAIDRLKKLNK
ncbi:MAG: carboxypeptidase-like regulatory domain-containing protein, partial [Prevotella sp.]|nr:carboxypeptidase-like regulatory domain-containing protein [Prevotella sp.]